MLKVGAILHDIDVNEPSGMVEWDTYIARTIRGGWVYATIKLDGITWGKRSTKHGDFGWLDPVPPWCRRKWRATDDVPSYYTIATTRIKALTKAIASQKEYGSDDDYEGITNAEIVKKLETMLKRERNKRKK